MFIIGIFIHVCFLFSIFDIYFKSPIVKNVTPYEPLHKAVADRLVLFIVDGLRAESFLNYTTMPYLRYLANSKGRWGISHTRVPTESRPGHVAVIAGFYEDPSAIAKGWKENPVDFDSVFNQTTFTWGWGTYDIVDIFTKGSVDNHISVKKFDPYDQTFSTDKNTTLLDAWVFENVKQFFADARNDKHLEEKLMKKKIVFFLHLLGTDTSGHTHKPKTQNFLTTIRFVDENIREIEMLVKKFYNDDGRTTFLMTADHGMTDWGSHGAGDDHETQTPYVIWGAGVNQATFNATDPETNNMSLEHRLDVNQADLTPLMSTILSIPVPVNSVGWLKSDLLNLTIQDKAKAIYSNARQLASQYNKKRSDVEASAIPLLYQPFKSFTEKKTQEMIEFTEQLLQNGEYEQLIIFSEEIMNLSLSGLTYYHNYYQRPLLVLVTLSFVGWIVCLLKILIEQKLKAQSETFTIKKNNSSRTLQVLVNIIFSLICLIATSLVYAQCLPVQYYIYFLMPTYLWWLALSKLNLWAQTFKLLNESLGVFTVWFEVSCYSIGALALGLSFTYRWMLSIPLFGMGCWPYLSSTKSQMNKAILFLWALSCLLLSLFSLIPVVGKDVFIELVILAGIIWLLLVVIYLWKVLLPLYIYYKNEENQREILLTIMQTVILVLSLQNIYVQSKRFEQGTPVSHVHQAMAWIIAVASFIMPLIHSRRLICRLMAISTSLLNFYLMLSVAHEGLFIVTLTLNVLCWIYIEFRLLHLENVKITECSFDKESFGKSASMTAIERSTTNHDFRRAFFFISYIILSFFGTGNIASLNSFEVRWVTCFLTSFQPFVITGLVLLKTLTPFLSVACGFRAVQHLTKAPTGCLNIIVLIYSNIMGLQLLFFVKNTGSWLEIGTSISQFVIVQVITLFIVLINQLAKVLTNVNIYMFANEVFRTRKKYV